MAAIIEVIESIWVAVPRAEAGIGYGVVGGLGSTSQQTDIVSLPLPFAEGQQYLPNPKSWNNNKTVKKFSY